MLQIVNSNETLLAYLNNLESAKVREKLNGEYTLSFITTVSDLKTEYLYNNENLIKYENDLFRIVQIEELHNSEGFITVSVACEHISYDLIKNAMPNFNYTNQTAAYVMLKALENTNFTFTGTDVTKITDIQYTQECNSKQITIAIANNWQGELKYFRYSIELLQERGQNRGTDFRFRKNLNSIKRIINYAEETVSYEVDVVGDNTTLALGYYELGDTCRVIDDLLKIDEYKRIIEVEKDIITGFNSAVILGDDIEDLRSSFSKTDSKIKEVETLANENAETITNNAEEWNKIKDVTDAQGNLVASKINGLLNTANAMIQNGTGTMSWTGTSLICHDQPTEATSTFIVELSANGIRFANNRNQDDSWNWRTALSAEGVVADKVYASAIAGLTIDAVTLTSTEITSGLITGVTMQGATIIGGNTDGIHTLISPTVPLRLMRGGNILAELGGQSFSNAGNSFLDLYYTFTDEGSQKRISFKTASATSVQEINNAEFTLSVTGTETLPGIQRGKMIIDCDSGFEIKVNGTRVFTADENGNVTLGGGAGIYINGTIYE